ncbi:MAG: MFS transporter [Opitutaceae bacterium]|nr:MFS transporter [Opitutaceae bacterium]
MTSAPEPTVAPRAWAVVGILFFVGGLCYLDRSLLAVMHHSVVQDVRMTDAQFGLLLSVYSWVYALLSPFCGFLADRFNRSSVIIGSLFLWSAVTALTAHAATFEELLACRIGLAVTEACYLPAALALITDYHRGRTRSLATGVHITGLMLGSALSGTGGILAEQYSWHMPYSVFGLAGMALSGTVLLFLRDPPRAAVTVRTEPAGSFVQALSSLFSYRSFTLVFLNFGLCAFAMGGLNGWMPAYLREAFHLSQGESGLSATAYFNIAAVFGLLGGGVWADRWSRTNPRGRILVSCIMFGLSAPCVLLIAHSGTLAPALLGLALLGLFYSTAGVNTMPILCQVTDARYRSTAYGVLNLLAGLMGGAAMYACGAMRDAQIDFRWYLYLAAACLLLAVTLLCFVKPLPPSESA